MYGLDPQARQRFAEIIQRERIDPRCVVEVAEHQIRVADLTRCLANWMGMDTELSSAAWLAGRFHDVGKLLIPVEVVYKQGPLEESEKVIMGLHTNLGLDLLLESGVAMPGFIMDAVLYHHERFDGMGRYSLRGREIPLVARMVAIADSFDAMRAVRSYKAGMSEAEALTLLVDDSMEGQGQHFDPSVVRSFISMRLADSSCKVSRIVRFRLTKFTQQHTEFPSPAFRPATPGLQGRGPDAFIAAASMAAEQGMSPRI